MGEGFDRSWADRLPRDPGLVAIEKKIVLEPVHGSINGRRFDRAELTYLSAKGDGPRAFRVKWEGSNDYEVIPCSELTAVDLDDGGFHLKTNGAVDGRSN